MNTPTIVVAVLTLWLVMGLGFLAEYVNARRKGKTSYEVWTSYEGLLFILSVVVPLIILIHKSLPG
jgi:heme/copper-type cytochrome/quinol oxidase subunit 2